jgi:hypothetical protein
MTKQTKTEAKARTRKVHTADNRPGAGRLLFAHMGATLEFFGMIHPDASKRKAVRRSSLATVIGETAINYHTRKTGCFARNADGAVVLTDAGVARFGSRVGRFGQEQGTAQVAESKTVKAMLDALRKGGTVEGIKFATEREVKI